MVGVGLGHHMAHGRQAGLHPSFACWATAASADKDTHTHTSRFSTAWSYQTQHTQELTAW